MSPHQQDLAHKASIERPEEFWAHQAEQLHWHQKPSKSLQLYTKKLKDGTSHPSWQWFPDGEISTSYNCLDRHVEAGRGDDIALIWDSPVTKSIEKYTYAQVLAEVEVLAGVLRENGVGKGDVVLVYMPMIPAAIFGMLATNRLGAIHAVVFGGFSPPSLAQRMDASKPKVILTASCGIEGAKGPIGYRDLVRKAIKQSKHKPSYTFVWQRDQLRWDSIAKDDGERDWERVVHSAKSRGIKAEAVPVQSKDPIYIIHTSGTTGLPKGVVRETAGHAVSLNFTIRYIFGIRPKDVILTASDIGWVVGHSYILYAPLLAGATTVLFEGKPIGTPDAGTFWRMVEQHKINVLFTAPTALRAIRNVDGKNHFFEEVGRRGGLKHLRALFLAGERSEPSIVSMYQDLLKEHCANGASVVDHWWSSESGSPITGLAQLAACGLDFADQSTGQPSLPVKPGAAGKCMPGFDVRVVDDSGAELPRGKMGNIVLGLPLAPSAFTTLWQDEARYYRGYLQRFNGKWLDTGDAGMIDEDGYVSVMSRADDIINVAAHRFSTGAIEQAVTSHASITEACVVGVPDALKGHLPFAFVTLADPNAMKAAVPIDQLIKEVNSLITEQIGAIARLGGMIQGQRMIPKTRSGKTLRRVLRELVENAVEGHLEKEVQVPSTIEDIEVIKVARERIKEYFDRKGKDLHKGIETKAKL